MKVLLSVHGRFHGFDLARELDRRGFLAGLVTTYPAFAVRRWLPSLKRLHTAPWLELARRAAQLAPVLPASDYAIARAFGRFSARHLDGSVDVFVGWSGASLEAISVARARGMLVVLERGSSHIRHQAEVLAEECQRFDMPPMAVDQRMIERETEEYQVANAIAVPSSYAASTFRAFGIPAERLIVNPYGVNLVRFAPAADPPRRLRPRILFVGRLGLRKGLPWLLRAFAPLAGEAELHLVGPLEPGMTGLLATLPTEGVVFRGPLRTPDLELAFREADIFCLPSIEEGFPLALLQAMASGLPVVVTPETGAADIADSGREGIIVPSRAPTALAEALAGLVCDSERRRAMGAAARVRVATGFTWSDYGNRAVAAYQGHLGFAENRNSLASANGSG